MTGADGDGPRRGHRRAWITAAVLGALLVVAPVAWQAWSYGTVRNATLLGGSEGRRVTALEIVGGSANVTVTPRADQEVGYRAAISWSLKAPTIEESWLGDTLRLTPHCPGEGSWTAAGAGCSVQLGVTVPADIPVKVTAGSGRVSLSGLGGAVDAETDSGRIEIAGLRGALRAKVGSGSLLATGLASPHADVRVGSGRADAAFATPPDQVTARVASGRLALTVPPAARFRVRCAAGSGRCEVPDALRDGGSPRTLDIESGVGRAEASYPAGP
ncbi:MULTISPECIES: hypothetical protein [unclassified Streptomyces]|uniref:hypothetical protein n=1 Tax=unclassified Streptomyces TaxID=2593676 RepID=UPI0022557839|nr:hypothetical protein [Streptomyces sp. NBC_00047]MCX5611491.1 DUF4097 domain-containing protein [Streptomyces sp. NBC_00047]